MNEAANNNFYDALPKLLEDKKFKGKWVAFVADKKEPVGVAQRETPLWRECLEKYGEGKFAVRLVDELSSKEFQDNVQLGMG